MATDATVEDNRPDGGYAVRLVIRSSNERHLQPPLELPDGIQAVVDGSEVVLTVPVRAPNAASALAAAKTTATDLLMVLASTFNGYEFVIDQRQLTCRTDAVYQAEGPPRPFDVAEGAVTEAGAEHLDPTGELRRWGRVITIRASASVTHPASRGCAPVSWTQSLVSATSRRPAAFPRRTELPRRDRGVHAHCCGAGSVG
jgi:hypothetical protein